MEMCQARVPCVARVTQSGTCTSFVASFRSSVFGHDASAHRSMCCNSSPACGSSSPRLPAVSYTTIPPREHHRAREDEPLLWQHRTGMIFLKKVLAGKCVSEQCDHCGIRFGGRDILLLFLIVQCPFWHRLSYTRGRQFSLSDVSILTNSFRAAKI